ncbi:MAG: hypothetical protein AB7U46_16500 [Paenirhodobacter sp.]|uniref:hypothetical protein n=1 Tax=Paenirhodobacter sp. TaxID=1965326 RepID=UPI003D14728D
MFTHWTDPCAPTEQAAPRPRKSSADAGPLPAGWWIAPMLLVGLSVWGAALYGLVLLLN